MKLFSTAILSRLPLRVRGDCRYRVRGFVNRPILVLVAALNVRRPMKPTQVSKLHFVPSACHSAAC